jgi:phosphoribosylformylglycinamidine cyclo-ligase
MPRSRLRLNNSVERTDARRQDAYAEAGVDAREASRAIGGLVAVLGQIDPGRPRRTMIGPGHYASVIAIDDRNGIALCTDGVGTKLIVAERARRFDTVGIDCVAMNVNDVICVGAEPLALVDYIAVERADAAVLQAIAEGLKRGAELAGVEIPGGELAQLPELIRGHPSPFGFDLIGSCFGTVPLDAIVTGAAIRPGDVVLGLPSSGIHSNGFTLARKSLLERAGLALDAVPAGLERTLADELLEPTEIYVRAVRALLSSGVRVHGLAHITGDGLLNLLRLNPDVGYELGDPLPPQPLFELIASAGELGAADMYETFNMGTGFCCVVDSEDGADALAVVGADYPSARMIGEVTAESGTVRLPSIGLTGTREGFRPA